MTAVETAQRAYDLAHYGRAFGEGPEAEHRAADALYAAKLAVETPAQKIARLQAEYDAAFAREGRHMAEEASLASRIAGCRDRNPEQAESLERQRAAQVKLANDAATDCIRLRALIAIERNSAALAGIAIPVGG